jgi:hypothetical protein
VDTSIRPALYVDIPYLAANMREADKREIWASSLASPEAALARSIEVSQFAWTGLIENRPVVMFGIGQVSILGGGASAWLLGTQEIEKIPRLFLTESREWVRKMVDRYGRLFNYVDARNRQTLRWLAFLGADFGPARPYGMLGKPFVPFVITRKEVANV